MSSNKLEKRKQILRVNNKSCLRFRHVTVTYCSGGKTQAIYVDISTCKWRAGVLLHNALWGFRLKALHSWEDTPVCPDTCTTQINVWCWLSVWLWIGLHNFKGNVWAAICEEGTLCIIWILSVVKQQGYQVTPGFQFNLSLTLTLGKLTYFCHWILFSEMSALLVSQFRCEEEMAHTTSYST